QTQYFSVALQDYADPLVNEEYDHGSQGVFKQIKGHDDQRHESKQAVNRGMHGGSHLDESLDRHSESLAVSRKQNERIKQAGCRRSQQRTHRHSFHRVSSALHMMQTVQNSRRHHEGTAEDKVGQI